MSRTAKNTNTQETAKTTNQVVPEKTEEYSNLHTIKEAIIAAHKSNNDSAINEDLIERCHISEQSLTQWKSYVSDLRKVTQDWVTSTFSKGTTKKQRDDLCTKVYSQWSRVLKNGLANDFSKNWFVREEDTAWLLRCAVKDVRSYKGSLYGFTSEGEFRRRVERLIGCRMASNAILSDEDAAIISAYDSAESRKKQAIERKDEGTKKVPSLKLQLEAAEKERDEKIEFFSKKDVVKENPELLADLTAIYDNKVTEIKNAIKAAEKSIKSANEIMAEKGKRYKEIMAVINDIEGSDPS